MLKNRDTYYAAIALALMAVLGVLLVFLFPGSPEQDTEYHFLMARSAWSDPSYFVNVWGRPLYTAVFAAPALLGFTATRLFAVCIGVGIAWQTWRLACDLQLKRAWLVIPLLLAQPVFFELFPDLLTEPLFALVFVIALRWHMHGWTGRGMLVASLLPLARPEGVFVCLLWGAWVLLVDFKRSSEQPVFQKIARLVPKLGFLATGVFLWWLAALCITHDPLFIMHNWPSTWHKDMYGHGNLLTYAARGREFLGELLILPFLTGLWFALRRREWLPVTTTFLLLFVLHTIFRAFGLFGEAGYPRYMVSVAPTIAVITLLGWNSIAAWLRRRIKKNAGLACGALGAVVLALALVQSFLYLDSFPWARDAVAIREMHEWMQAHPRPFQRLIWSNARMCIITGIDPVKNPSLLDRNSVLQILRDTPSQTLVFWDDHIGPEWFGLTAGDIAKAGYQSIRIQHYSLAGITNRDMDGRKVENREVELSLLYKP